MEPWIYVLLLKPIAVFGVAGAYYVAVYKPVKWLAKRLPDSRLKHALFRERGTYSATPPTDGN